MYASYDMYVHEEKRNAEDQSIFCYCRHCRGIGYADRSPTTLEYWWPLSGKTCIAVNRFIRA